MSLFAAFSRHPAAVDETYGEHFVFASGVGGRLMLAGLACLLHGIFPFLFERTGRPSSTSTTVSRAARGRGCIRSAPRNRRRADPPIRNLRQRYQAYSRANVSPMNFAYSPSFTAA